MTRPYHQGSTSKLAIKAHKWRALVKPAHTIELEEPKLNLVEPHGQAEVMQAEEKLAHINSSYTSTTTSPTRICQSLYRVYLVQDSKVHDQWGLPAN